MNIAIIGAGASGLAAAIKAARTNSEACIVVLEKKDRPATKLMATGNGRCNITNASCEDYDKTLAFLNSVGIFTEEEDEGRVYPFSGQAKDVCTALLSACNSLGVDIKTNMPVSKISTPKEDGGEFEIFCENGKSLKADKVIIAAGGKAAPQFGTSGDSYTLAKALGHSINKLAPVLTPLEISGFEGQFKGIRAKAEVTLYKRNQEIAIEKGEIQFTETGVSGICIFNLSRFVVLDKETNFGDYSIKVDLFRGSEDLLFEILKSQKSIDGLLAGEILRTLVHERLAEALLYEVGIKVKQKALEVPNDKLIELAKLIKSLMLNVKGAGGWNQAQCTRGGVELSEIDPSSMESKIIKNLYITGEALDYDGPCGGFNLQNAWMSGILAGVNAAHVL